jgi:hypothetical protein
MRAMAFAALAAERAGSLDHIDRELVALPAAHDDGLHRRADLQ